MGYLSLQEKKSQKSGFNEGVRNVKKPISIRPQPIRPQPTPRPFPDGTQTPMPTQTPSQINAGVQDQNSYGGWDTWSQNNPGKTLDDFKIAIQQPIFNTPEEKDNWLRNNPGAIHGGTGLPYETKPQIQQTPRQINIEKHAIDIFTKKFGRQPETKEDWIQILKMVYPKQLPGGFMPRRTLPRRGLPNGEPNYLRYMQ